MTETTDKVRLQSFFGFSRIPFTKYMRAKQMFESDRQMELIRGLELFLEMKGMCLVYGAPGVGKSITLRRFKEELDERRCQIFYLFNVRSTPLGFFRSLSRMLGLTPSMQKADLFDAAHSELVRFEERTNRHPILILDDCDGLSDELLENIRLLTNYAMDSEDRFSVILAGTPGFAARLNQGQNQTLKQRIAFSYGLRGFTVRDAKKYIHFHLKRAEGRTDLFRDDAIALVFQLAHGYPRVINQLASHALIRAAIKRKDKIDEKFLRQQVLANSLFEAGESGTDL